MPFAESTRGIRGAAGTDGEDALVQVATGTASTNGAQTVEIFRWTPPLNAARYYRIKIRGFAAGVGGLSLDRWLGVDRLSGNPSLQGGGFAGGYSPKNTSLNSASLTVAVSGSDVVISVLGQTGQTIAWQGGAWEETQQ